MGTIDPMSLSGEYRDDKTSYGKSHSKDMPLMQLVWVIFEVSQLGSSLL
jgi:hypothetical protein